MGLPASFLGCTLPQLLRGNQQKVFSGYSKMSRSLNHIEKALSLGEIFTKNYSSVVGNTLNLSHRVSLSVVY